MKNHRQPLPNPSGLSRRRLLEGAGAAALGAMAPGCRKPALTMPLVFPGTDWESLHPADAGFDPGTLDRAIGLVAAEAGDAAWQVIVNRFGRTVANRWGPTTDPALKWPIASLGKSVYVSMLGIAIAEGKIGSADDRLVDYYPEIEGAAGVHGPYPDGGRSFSEQDREVTLRQLATHTGGFMRADEPPGSFWTYDTFGMATLLHAIAKQYGYYDPAAVDSVHGSGALIEEKIRNPIGATWTWKYTNFQNHPPEARLELFSNYVTFFMDSANDLARLGLLWLAEGRWKDREIIPGDWHRESIRVAPAIKAVAPEEKWVYGQGFWVNETGALWPNLPRDSYLAGGFPNHLLWICPSLSLIAILSPGLPPGKRFENTVAEAARALEPLVAAVKR